MLFINPSVHLDTQPNIFKPFLQSSFPTAIGYLAGYLREKNKDSVKIYDEQMGLLNENKLRDELEKIEGPKIVGMTCLTVTAKRAYELTHLIKKIDPEVVVVLGGIHATAVPEECLKKTSADIVVRGEGEETLSEIYEAIKAKEDFKTINGISYKENENLIHNPPRDLIKDLDAIPAFPYDLFEHNIDLYKDFGAIISSRGCPYSCIFCSQRLISKQRYRFLPNYRIINKIKLLVDKYHQEKIFFVDDTFTINRKRTFALLDEIIASGYHKKVGFIVESRGKEITWELLMKMKEANVVSIVFGVETGSERMMSKINKGETVEDNINGIKLTHKAGIATDSSFVMGLPTETKEDRKLSSKLARELPLDGARFNIAIPYPGTEFYKIAQKEGRLNISDDWINFSNQHYMSSDDIPYTPANTSSIELVYDTFMANLRFSLKPRNLIKILFSPFLTGGTVFSIPKNWYASPKMWFAIIKLSTYIVKRYIMILMKRGMLFFSDKV
jgi:anaerobic magnesium-protoporphyrin IX monomethyl ester cyclase